MRTVRLSRVNQRSWSNGNIHVRYWPWTSQKWGVQWSDAIGGHHRFECEDRRRMNERTERHGFRIVLEKAR